MSNTKLALVRLVFDIAAPIVLYYVLRSEGVSYALALMAGAALPGLGAGVMLALRRRADPVAVIMVVALASAVAGSLIARSPRFLLAKDGLITGMWGGWFLASARGQRPAALAFARPLMEGMGLFAGRSWDLLWATEPSSGGSGAYQLCCGDSGCCSTRRSVSRSPTPSRSIRFPESAAPCTRSRSSHYS